MNDVSVADVSAADISMIVLVSGARKKLKVQTQSRHVNKTLPSVLTDVSPVEEITMKNEPLIETDNEIPDPNVIPVDGLYTKRNVEV